MAGVLLEGVSRRYSNGVLAVDRLDLEVRDGEFLVLVGPSGSGKTTTLRLIAGLEALSTGQIRIGDRVVNGVPPRYRQVALVSQIPALVPHLRVRENLTLGLRMRFQGSWPARLWKGWRHPAEAAASRRLIDERVREVAQLMGLDGLLARWPAELSGGEQQRVALARALVRRPQAFLLDEPLAHVDPRARYEIRQELKRLQCQLGVTVVYVTHDYRDALSLGDRVAVLQRGRIEQIGPPQTIYDEPASRFVAGFVGSPPMNLWEGVWTGDGVRGGRFETAEFSLPVDSLAPEALQRYAGKRVVLGLRPQFVRPGIEVAGKSTGADGASVGIEARIVSIEPEGDQTLVSLDIGPDRDPRGTVRGVADVGSGWKLGDRATAWFDMRHARWFDPDDGRAIGGRTA
jgi:multiple sugar transport system ATP-binding protein